MSNFGGLMGCTIAGLLMTGGCAPPTEPAPGGEPDMSVQYVVAGRPIETDEGLYVLEFSPFPNSNFAWPSVPGRTRVALDVRTGPEFMDDDDESTMETPTYPLMLTFEAVDPPTGATASAFFPEGWPTNSEGTQWTLALDLSEPGDWVLPISVADGDGHIDRVRVTFRVVAPTPPDGRPARVPG